MIDRIFVRQYAPVVIMGCTALTVLLSLFGEDSFFRLKSLRYASIRQDQDNLELRTHVEDLRKEVSALKYDPRALEKAARNELGLASDDEEIYVFERRRR